MALAASTRVRFPAALHFENRLQRLCVWLCWAFANPDLRCPLYAGHLGGGTYNRVSHECVEGAKLLTARITHAAKSSSTVDLLFRGAAMHHRVCDLASCSVGLSFTPDLRC